MAGAYALCSLASKTYPEAHGLNSDLAVTPLGPISRYPSPDLSPAAALRLSVARARSQPPDAGHCRLPSRSLCVRGYENYAAGA